MPDTSDSRRVGPVPRLSRQNGSLRTQARLGKLSLRLSFQARCTRSRTPFGTAADAQIYRHWAVVAVGDPVGGRSHGDGPDRLGPGYKGVAQTGASWE